MQKRFINYKDVIESFPLVEKNMGIFKSGRYSGFDSMSSAGDLIVNIEHLPTIKKTIENGSQVVSFGSFITPTGTIIHEEAPVTLTISPNTGNSNTRRDFIIAEHTQTQIQEGTAAEYSVIQGPNNGDDPVLVDDKTQVILCVVTIEPEGTEYSDLTLEVVDTPLLGAMNKEQLYLLLKLLINAGLPIATNTVKGIADIATNTEGLTGEDNQKFITAAVLSYVLNNLDIVFDPDYVQTENNFTDELKTLLENLDPEAEKNVNPDWLSTGGDSEILNKPNVVDVLLQGRTTQAFDINGGSSGYLSNIGFSSVYRTNSGDSTDIVEFNFPSLGTLDYQVLISYESSGSVNGNNEWQGMAILNKSLTSFEAVIRETDSETQSVLLSVTLIKHKAI